MDDYQLNSIALKTLRQRCEYLQQRLVAVEEENYKLKVENAKFLNNKIPKESNKLEEQVIILNKENSQMARQIQMISNENSTLWSHLFKILPENNMSSLKIPVSTAPDNPVLKLSQYDTSNDYSKESLEEISLKLINGIIMGKNEMERQYSQMVDLQKENIVEESSSFTSKQIDNRIASKNFKDYLQKLKDFKQALVAQKSELSNAISFLKTSTTLMRQGDNLKEDISKFNYYRDATSNISPQLCVFSNVQDSVKVGSGDSKLDLNETCPICEIKWKGNFDDFEKHVMKHFGE